MCTLKSTHLKHSVFGCFVLCSRQFTLTNWEKGKWPIGLYRQKRAREMSVGGMSGLPWISVEITWIMRRRDTGNCSLKFVLSGSWICGILCLKTFYEGHTINKLQGGIILLISKIRTIQYIRFVVNLTRSGHRSLTNASLNVGGTAS